MTTTARRKRAPAKRRATSPVQRFIYGSVAVAVGVLWLVIQATVSASPGSPETHIVLKILPWIVVLVGLGFAGWGYNGMHSARRRAVAAESAALTRNE